MMCWALSRSPVIHALWKDDFWKSLEGRGCKSTSDILVVIRLVENRCMYKGGSRGASCLYRSVGNERSVCFLERQDAQQVTVAHWLESW